MTRLLIRVFYVQILPSCDSSEVGSISLVKQVEIVSESSYNLIAPE